MGTSRRPSSPATCASLARRSSTSSRRPPSDSHSTSRLSTGQRGERRPPRLEVSSPSHCIQRLMPLSSVKVLRPRLRSSSFGSSRSSSSRHSKCLNILIIVTSQLTPPAKYAPYDYFSYVRINRTHYQ